LVKPDRRAPILTSQVWYKVGSSYEHGGITGVSHVLEHMMFKGTEHHGPGEFSRIIAENGGEENAFTGADYTAYYQNLASDRVEVSFELEADRMRHLSLEPKSVQKEVEVVKEERRMRTDDDPQSLTYEQFNATAFAASPYRNPVIGWPGDLNELTLTTSRTGTASGMRRTMPPWSWLAMWTRSRSSPSRKSILARSRRRPSPRRRPAKSRLRTGRSASASRPRPRSPIC
jgi:zinc protease